MLYPLAMDKYGQLLTWTLVKVVGKEGGRVPGKVQSSRFKV